MQNAAALLCGVIFGLGLLISGMVQPSKVLAFLDIFGMWDPSLAVVMAAALAVSAGGYRIIAFIGRPVLASRSSWPVRRDIDAALVVGAVLFGIGWGLVGLCPGPALENIATLSPRVIAFVAAMAAGMVLHRIWQAGRAGRHPQQAPITTATDG